jgi:hypothetical protein
MLNANSHCCLPLTQSKKHLLQSTTSIICPHLLKLKKKQDKVAQLMAQDFELIQMQSLNGVINKYGDMKGTIDQYKENGFAIARLQLEYWNNLQKKYMFCT